MTKSVRTRAIENQELRDMEPQDIFRRLAQLQPNHKRIWLRSFAYWKRKKTA